MNELIKRLTLNANNDAIPPYNILYPPDIYHVSFVYLDLIVPKINNVINIEIYVFMYLFLGLIFKWYCSKYNK